MKKILPFLFLQIAAAHLAAQSLTPASVNFLGGEAATSAGGSLTFSTAEIGIQHLEKGNFWLTEGFQQLEQSCSSKPPKKSTPTK